MLHNSNYEDIREVTWKQGHSQSGRKLLKQNKNASTSKQNTRARSRGLWWSKWFVGMLGALILLVLWKG